MNSISLGRYVPYDTLIHKMDPRSKIIALIAVMVAVFIKLPTWGMTFVFNGALALIVLAILLISKVSLVEVFKSLKVLWFFIIIVLIINTLLPGNNIDKEVIFFSIGKVNVYRDSIFQSLKIVLRLIMMIELTMILTSTTKPLDLTYALEWFLTPLKYIKFPTHEVAMVISIALRFIPTLLDETTRIMKAQESRGVDFKYGRISTRMKAIVSLIIPLFISAFERSEQLADSMEARGYNPSANRTRYRILSFHFIDAICLLVSILILSGIIVLSTVTLF